MERILQPWDLKKICGAPSTQICLWVVSWTMQIEACKIQPDIANIAASCDWEFARWLRSSWLGYIWSIDAHFRAACRQWHNDTVQCSQLTIPSITEETVWASKVSQQRALLAWARCDGCDALVLYTREMKFPDQQQAAAFLSQLLTCSIWCQLHRLIWTWYLLFPTKLPSQSKYLHSMEIQDTIVWSYLLH